MLKWKEKQRVLLETRAYCPCTPGNKKQPRELKSDKAETQDQSEGLKAYGGRKTGHVSWILWVY